MVLSQGLPINKPGSDSQNKDGEVLLHHCPWYAGLCGMHLLVLTVVNLKPHLMYYANTVIKLWLFWSIVCQDKTGRPTKNKYLKCLEAAYSLFNNVFVYFLLR